MFFQIVVIAIILYFAWPYILAIVFPPNLKKKYANKVVIITGASSGLGQEIALQISKFSPKLMLAARNTDKLKEIQKHCKDLGAEVEICTTDVSESAQCKALAEATVKAFGKIDIVIANAGIGMAANVFSLKDTTVLDQVMKVDFGGAVNTVFWALPELRKSNGHVTVISSIYGRIPGRGVTAYVAAKHAILGFFDSLRLEEKRNKINITVVCPGFINTDIHNRSLNADGKSVGPVKTKSSYKLTETTVGNAASVTLAATAANRKTVFLPTPVYFIASLRAIFPEFMDKYL